MKAGGTSGELNWGNHHNQAFYNVLPIQVFQHYAEMGGLQTHSDLHCIQAYIEASGSILEVGAGFGRVVDYLLQQGFQGEIIAIERCTSLCHFLKDKYADAKVQILQRSILDLAEETRIKPVDLVLWLWSGISEFSHQEQINALRQLKQLTARNGMLVVETLSEKELPLGLAKKQEDLVLANLKQEKQKVFLGHYEDTSISIFNITDEEIEGYADQLNLYVKHRNYHTSSGRTRSLHLFTHEPFM